MPIFSCGVAPARAPFERALLGCAFAIAVLLCAARDPASAHEGHDHGADKAALEISSLNRAAAISETYQVVAALDRDTLVVTLDRLATNEPVRGATISIMIGAVEKTATPRPNGT